MFHLSSYDFTQINPTWAAIAVGVFTGMCAIIAGIVQSPARNSMKLLGVALISLVTTVVLGGIFYVAIIIPQSSSTPSVLVPTANSPDLSVTSTPILILTQPFELNTQMQTVTPIPLGFPGNPVTSNSSWSPEVQTLDGVQMALVPAGCFMMGDHGAGGEQCFEAPFWIDVYEVDNQQYRSSGYFSGVHQPRDRVTWSQARDFCVQKRIARLPTESEWEYAARGPDNLVYPWGNNYVASFVAGGANSNGQSADVGTHRGGVSWVGAHDLSGNVWEWVNTIFEGFPFPYASDDGRENNIAASQERVVRGGSWYTQNNLIFRAFSRDSYSPDTWSNSLGFRCARDY